MEKLKHTDPAHSAGSSNQAAITPADKRTKTVPVVVQARFGQSVSHAGRSWGVEPTKHDAVPAEVVDLLKAPAALHVQWPEGWVAPDGSIPSERKMAASAINPMLTSADRVATAEAQALAAVTERQATEVAFATYRAKAEGEAGDLRRALEEAEARGNDLGSQVSGASITATQAKQAAETQAKAHAQQIEALNAQHRGELDTLRAQHEAALAALTLSADARVAEATATVTELMGELEKLTNPPTAPVAVGAVAAATLAAQVPQTPAEVKAAAAAAKKAAEAPKPQ